MDSELQQQRAEEAYLQEEDDRELPTTVAEENIDEEIPPAETAFADDFAGDGDNDGGDGDNDGDNDDDFDGGDENTGSADPVGEDPDNAVDVAEEVDLANPEATAEGLAEGVPASGSQNLDSENQDDQNTPGGDSLGGENTPGEPENPPSEVPETSLPDNLPSEMPETSLPSADASGNASGNEDDIFNIPAHKTTNGDGTRKKRIRRTEPEEEPMEYAEPAVYEDSSMQKRRTLEERMDQAVKSRTVRRKKADEDDLERMQDDKIDLLKSRMIEAANLDVEKNSQGLIATEKLKLLKEVMDTMSKADLAISILDNNLLEAVRLWLEPLPDASMPAYQIQKELLHALATLPVKTDHLVASGIGKVLVFYQKSTRTEANLKKTVDRLIGDWTRPILNKSDSYKDRTIRFHQYNKTRFVNQLSSQRRANKAPEPKSLYEQQAERRNRAAIPSARTTAYKIAPKVDPSLLMRGLRDQGDRFSRINRKMTNSKKKTVRKNGPSIEGKNLSI